MRRLLSGAPMILLVLAASGCSLDKQQPPALSGPSSFAMTVALTASPASLPRDGGSTSTITVSAQDPQQKPLAGQRLLLTTTAGTLSATEVTTNSSGLASFRATAPSLNENVSSMTITATPVDSTNSGAPVSAPRNVVVAVIGPTVPTASFTYTPTSPGQFDLVTFDASGSKLSGSACGSTCTYGFDFGDGSSTTGQVVSHRYSSVGTFAVTLTVTAPGGTQSTSMQTVTVGSAQSITASFTISPTDPHTGDTVRVDASASKTPDGTSISSYDWDFGCVSSTCTTQTASGMTASTTYSSARTYTIRLTITDSVGRTATNSQTVTVK